MVAQPDSSPGNFPRSPDRSPPKHNAITCNPNDSFRDLRTELAKVHDPATLAELLNNGLTGEENLQLLTEKSFGKICDKVW